MRLWVLPVLFLLLSVPFVSAQNEAAGAFIKSMSSGDYSYLRPYLSAQMQSAFPESKFRELRNSFIEKYGRITNISYAGSEGGYAYVKVNFEKAAVTFKLVIKDGKIYGIWIVGVSRSSKSGLTPQEAMMEALVRDNYSIAERYFSPLMKKVFTKALFERTRGMIIQSCGEIRGYSLERREGDVYYYRLLCEKRSVTVTVTVKGGLIEGFHMGFPGFNFALPVLYPLIGALLAVLALWAYLRVIKFAELLLGMAVLLISLVIQIPIQTIPRLVGAGNLIFLAVWAGFIAAIVQEPLKYYFSRDKGLKGALYIGAGFGLAEGILTLGIALISGGAASPLAILERFLVLMFHASTTLFFAYAYREGWGKKALGTMVLIHGVMDSLAAYWKVAPSLGLLATIYIITALTAGIVLFTLIGKAKNEVEEAKIVW